MIRISKRIASVTALWCRPFGMAALAAAVLTMAACAREEAGGIPPRPGDPGAKVRIEIHTDADSFARPVSKALADEDAVGDTPWVLVFTGTGDNAVFSEAVEAQYTGTATVAELTETTVPGRILVIANAGSQFDPGSGPVNFDAAGLASVLAGAKVADLNERLRTVPLAAGFGAAVPYVPARAIPMTGMVEAPDGINRYTRIGTAINKLPLRRIAAKVTVSSTAPGFELLAVGAIYVNRNGSYYRSGGPILKPYGFAHYLSGMSGDGGMGGYSPAVDNTTAGSPLYMFESDPWGNTSLIVQGRYEGNTYFYRLAFCDPDQNLLSVERNRYYSFTIRSAAPGYLTLEEVLGGGSDPMPPANIDYGIVVTDLSSHEIVDNGAYYLGVSNSRFEAHTDDPLTVAGGIVAVTVTTDAGLRGVPLMTVGTNVSGAGTMTVSPSGDIPLDPSGTTTVGLKIAMDTGFGTASEGTVTIRTGTLTRTVTVRRLAPFNAAAGTYLWPSAVAAKVESPGDEDRWLTLSLNGVVSVGKEVVRGDAGELYAFFTRNNSYFRYGVVYVSMADRSRTKAYVKQRYYAPN